MHTVTFTPQPTSCTPYTATYNPGHQQAAHYSLHMHTAHRSLRRPFVAWSRPPSLRRGRRHLMRGCCHLVRGYHHSLVTGERLSSLEGVRRRSSLLMRGLSEGLPSPLCPFITAERSLSLSMSLSTLVRAEAIDRARRFGLAAGSEVAGIMSLECPRRIRELLWW